MKVEQSASDKNVTTLLEKLESTKEVTLLAKREAELR